MPDIEELLAGATLRRHTVPVCLDGDASAELEAAEAELEGLGEWVPTSMGETNPAVALIERVEAAREAVRAARHDFAFQALGHTTYSRLLAAHPPAEGAPEGSHYDAGTFLPVLLSQCCTDPVMSLPQVELLLDRVNDGQARQMYAAALEVNEEPSPIPF
jgi:hypothetical protein